MCLPRELVQHQKCRQAVWTFLFYFCICDVPQPAVGPAQWPHRGAAAPASRQGRRPRLRGQRPQLHWPFPQVPLQHTSE